MDKGVFKHRDSKISKRVLGQDGTTDGSASGTYGSLKIFQDVAADRHKSDKTDIKYLINKELLWRLELISPAYKGITSYKFDWDESKEMTPAELIESVGKLESAGFEVDEKYVSEKTGIPIKGRKQIAPVPGNDPEPDPDDQEKKKPQSKQNLNARIFNEIVAFYDKKLNCGDPGVIDINALDISNFTKLIEKVAKDLHDGNLKPSDLNPDLLRQTYQDLSSAMGDGYGKTFTSYTDKNVKRVLDLKQNLYRFSGAKTYQELAKMNFMLQGDDGNPRSWEDFKKEALKINDQYNLNYLKTEYNKAQRAGEMAIKWSKYESQSKLYPNLQYKTVKDDRVREEHHKNGKLIVCTALRI